MKVLPAHVRAGFAVLLLAGALPAFAQAVVIPVDVAPGEVPDAPAVALAADGSFVIAWQAGTADAGLEIRARRYAASGLPRGLPFAVNPVAAGEQSAPSVIVAGDGTAWIAWSERAAGRDGVWVQGLAPDGVPLGPPVPVNTPARALADQPQLLADGAAGFAIAWAEPLPRTTTVMPRGCAPARCTSTVTEPVRLSLRRYGAGGAGASAPVGVADFALETASGARPQAARGTRLDRYRLVATASGGLAVAWQQTLLPALGAPRVTLHWRGFDADNAGQRSQALLRRVAGCARDSGFSVLEVLGLRTTALLEGDGSRPRSSDGSGGDGTGGCALDLVQQGRFADSRQRVDAPASAGEPAMAADAGGQLLLSWASGGGWFAQAVAAGGAPLGGNQRLVPEQAGVSYGRVALAGNQDGQAVVVARRERRDAAGTLLETRLVALRR